ncbi:MAG: pseudouridine synthase [Lachnospiraceae bacterium]|nr:pseudouridine synthase [Lachnospiraceae bacterium]
MTVRINKYLASCGVCSRRDADALIAQGRVRVNGQVAQMGTKVEAGDVVELNGKLLRQQESKVVLAFYKPVGVVCTERDPHASKKILDGIDYPVRVTYAGRLDKDSEGLILLTNDGGLIDAMMRGNSGHEKEYVVKVDREVTSDFLQGMSEGVYLKELDMTTRPCRLQQLGKFSFCIVLTQGLNRQIRRMCKAFGYEVKTLKRIRVLNIGLEQLTPGKYREIRGSELAELYAKCGL